MQALTSKLSSNHWKFYLHGAYEILPSVFQSAEEPLQVYAAMRLVRAEPISTWLDNVLVVLISLCVAASSQVAPFHSGI